MKKIKIKSEKIKVAIAECCKTDACGAGGPGRLTCNVAFSGPNSIVSVVQCDPN